MTPDPSDIAGVDELRLEVIKRHGPGDDGPRLESYLVLPDGTVVVGNPSQPHTSAFAATPQAVSGFERAALRVAQRGRPDLHWSPVGRDDADATRQRRASAGDDDAIDSTA